MIETPLYREENAVVNCPRCQQQLLLRYRADRRATAERQATHAKLGTKTSDSLTLFEPQPYLLYCPACNFESVPTRARRARLTPAPTPSPVKR